MSPAPTEMVRDTTATPSPRSTPGIKRRGPRAKSLKRLVISTVTQSLNSTKFDLKQGPQLSPFQERLKETDFYTKPVEEKFENTRSVKVSNL